MKRSDLARILSAACFIGGDDNIVVIASQSILGSFDESELPARATMSREADIAFWDDPDGAKSDAVDGAIGEQSDFDARFEYYAQGVSISTAVLPSGWADRLVRFKPNESAAATGWCLEPHDLALSKLAAHRPKDYDFVEALLDANLLEAATLVAWLPTMEIPTASRSRIAAWVNYHAPNRGNTWIACGQRMHETRGSQSREHCCL